MFVSSTFEDFADERDALWERVFPDLRRLCAAHGARLHVIDLRWGVSEAAAQEQVTMATCLAEIDRCQQLTPRPNFIALLGDRFGWQPLPASIPAAEFRAISDLVTDPEDAALFAKWYERDMNAIPEAFVLRPRAVEPAEWEDVEDRLRRALLTGIAETAFDARQRLKYEASACEQELEAALAGGPVQRGQVLGFVREIDGVDEGRVGEPFVDLDESGRRDPRAANGVARVHERLRAALPDGVHTYQARLEDGAVESGYLDRLCRDVQGALEAVIREELQAVLEVDAHEWDLGRQQMVMEDLASEHVGRDDALAAIGRYLARPTGQPLVVHGPAGSGKSLLIAEAARRAATEHPDAEHIIRFVGETPASSNLRALLLSSCTQLTRAYGFDESSLPVEVHELAVELAELVQLSGARRPPMIFIDGPDHLPPLAGGTALDWIPAEIPKHARFVVAVRPGSGLEALQLRLPVSQFVALEAMSTVEGEVLLNRWLVVAERTLQHAQREAVLGSFATHGLPLQLRLTFERARRWRSSLPPPPLADDLASSVRQLMERLSLDENHGRVLVERAVGYLAASRRGLTEDELMDLLAADRHVMDDFRRRSPLSPVVDLLPTVVWSRLFLDLGAWLTERPVDGTVVLAIQSPEIRSYAEDTYLTGDQRLARHRAIAHYFSAQPSQIEHDDETPPNLRRLSELPYQQAHGELWDDLETTLTDFGFLESRLRAEGVEALLADFEDVLAAGYPRRELQSIHDALRQSAHVLRSDPDQLASSLETPAGTGAIVPGWTLVRTLAGHERGVTRGVTAIAMTSDGRQALSGGEDGTLRFWNIDTGRQECVLSEPAGADERLFSHLGEINDATVTPDGQRALAATANSKITIWDIGHQRQLAALKGHEHQVRSVCVTPDGKRVVSGSWDQTIRVWSLDSLTEIAAIHGHDSGIETIALTPDGTRLISGDRDGTLRIWDLTSSVLLTMREQLALGIDPTAFHGDEFDQPRGSAAGEAVTALHTLTGHEGAINAVVATTNGKAVSGGEDATLRVWDLAAGVETRVVDAGASVLALSVSGDGRHTLAGGIVGGATLWDLETGEKRMSIPGSVTALALTPDGQQILTGSDDGDLRVWRYG